MTSSLSRSSIQAFLDRYHLSIIILLTITVSIVGFIYFYQLDLITAYGDSRAHLNIARRAVDGLTPGLAQLGGAWLPLLHALMLPTVWHDFMWQSGISGSLVNMLAYIVSMIVLYKLVYEITKNKLNAFLGYLIVALNINIIYFQATPMTEMLFISTLIIAIYLLVRWRTTESVLYLIGSGFFFFLSSFNRYEGWAVVPVAMILVGLISLIKNGKSQAEANVIMFGTVAGLGIALWILWQLVIFGDPLDFLKNDFAAGVNTARDVQAGQVPTYDNLLLSFLTEIYASFHTSGIVITVLGFLAIAIFIFLSNKKIFHSKKVLILLGMIPFLFEVLVVYKGIVPVHVLEIPIDGNRNSFNVRYALYFLPAIAVFIATVSKKTLVVLLLLIIAVVNNVLLAGGGKVMSAIQENGIIKPIDWQKFEAISRAYDKQGYLLASSSGTDATLFELRIPMKKLIYEGSGKYWKESLENPQRYATWILINRSERDLLYKKLNMEKVNSHFELKEEVRGFKLYKIKHAPTIGIT